MTERPFQFKKIKQEEVFHYKPPVWCSAICRNAFNEICIEDCSAHRDAKHFEPKEGMNIEDMPRFPLDDFLHKMTPDERKACVGIYTSRLVDNAQGVRHEQSYRPIRRPNSNGSRTSPLSENIEEQSLQHGQSEGNTVYQAETKREDQAIGPDSLVESSD